MREIKFRIFDKVNRQMLYMDTFEFWDCVKEKIEYLEQQAFEVKLSDIKDIELMQYTGLKDNNGKEIYEGDILDFKTAGDKRHSRGIVEIDDDLGILIKDNDKSLSLRLLANFMLFKVVGNKFELKSKDDILNQLKDLREHCEEMGKDGDAPWSDDVKALNYAINMLREQEDEE